MQFLHGNLRLADGVADQYLQPTYHERPVLTRISVYACNHDEIEQRP